MGERQRTVRRPKEVWVAFRVEAGGEIGVAAIRLLSELYQVTSSTFRNRPSFGLLLFYHIGRLLSFGSAVSFIPIGSRRSLSSRKPSRSQPACSGDKAISSLPSLVGPSLSPSLGPLGLSSSSSSSPAAPGGIFGAGMRP